MGTTTKIEWCDHTFNPWRGCSKVSSGCDHCYAERMSKRNPTVFGEWGPEGKRAMAAESTWKTPLAWNHAAACGGVRRRVFCGSMCDVFENFRMDYETACAMNDARDSLWQIITQTPSLYWLLVTKRPENAVALTPPQWRSAWPSNVWLGVSVENQASADERIPILLQIPAAVRFLSCEPLLGEIDIRTHLLSDYDKAAHDPQMTGLECGWNKVDWVIVGGESGQHARPMHPDWVRSVRDQCQEWSTPFFFKQWGEWLPAATGCGMTQPVWDNGRVDVLWLSNGGTVYERERDDAEPVARVGKKAAGNVLDGRTWLELPKQAKGA